MKQTKLIRFALAVFLGCAGASLWAKPPGISYAGGDGSSLEKAIIINGATSEETGVRAEYDYIGKHYPGYKRGNQGLLNSKGKAFDMIEFTTAGGKKMAIYFDITAFLGK
jgi:hypothetical protein